MDLICCNCLLSPFDFFFFASIPLILAALFTSLICCLLVLSSSLTDQLMALWFHGNVMGAGWPLGISSLFPPQSFLTQGYMFAKHCLATALPNPLKQRHTSQSWVRTTALLTHMPFFSGFQKQLIFVSKPKSWLSKLNFHLKLFN